MASATGSVPDFRFQGSYADDTTKLSWAVTRWYAPAQGRFISEDSLLGEPKDPDSRHLYAYAEGDAVGAWDPEGRRPVSFADLYGNARASRSGRIPLHSRAIRGHVQISLFIPTHTLCTPLVPICGSGDSRSFSNPFQFDCLRSRVCIDIDYSHGFAEGRANPSCGVVQGDCRSARPWTDDVNNALVFGKNGLKADGSWSSGFWGFLDREKNNICPEKWVHVGWSVQQAYYWSALPSIDGAVNVRRCGNRLQFEVRGDGYPDFEMSYFDELSVLRRSLRVANAGGPQYLAGFFGDWRTRFWVPVKPRNKR